MDRRSWPWKKKSSDKTEKAAVATDSGGGGSLASSGSQADKDNYKKPNYVQISVESYTHLTGLEDQVKTYEQQVQTLEDQINELNEKLSAANSEMTTKENLVKQHAKVAEEAVSGWEKAEAEALALKNHLESVTLSKLTAEDRAAHLDGALKECMRQIRNLKEEHEQKLQDVVLTKIKQCDKIKLELEAKMANLDQELLRSAAENAALSRSLQERSNMLIKISEGKSQAEAEIELLKSNIESCEREINSHKYELHIISKELEIRNEEKNMSMRSAEVANKQHMEGVKKIAKLEAECQRLRGLVRKKLPGPAALAQMKLEVESLGRDCGDSRLRRSPVKPPSPHLSAVPEFSLDNAQKFHKENEFLTERLLAMEEETKMLKEALAKRNSELQASRNLCAKTASRLQSLEAQVSNQQKSSPTSVVQVPIEGYSSQNMSNPPSLTSMSEDGNDDDRSCADSWATSLISELSQLKKEKSSEKLNKTKNTQHLELMDDFLEMEKLACLNANGAITISDSLNNKTSEIANGDTSAEVSLGKDTLSEEQGILDSSVNLVSSMSAANSGSEADQPRLVKLRSRISMLLESISQDADMGKILEDVQRIVQDTHGAVSSVSEDVRATDATCPEYASITGDKEITLFQDTNAATDTVRSVNQELATAVSSIHDFVLFLGKEAMAVHDTSSDGSDLSQKIEHFSVTFNKVLNGNTSLIDFIFYLSCVLAKASELRFNVLGYKGSEAEINSSDCIDKVALPENKVLQRDSSGESYQNSCAHISSPTSNPEVPDDGSLVSGYGSNTTLCKVSLEEFEELKSEKNNVALDLARCTENLEMTKSQLHETEQLLAEAKSQLASAQKSNSLAETQLKCMAESYRSLEARAEELETEVNLLQAKAETLENELQDEKQCHWDALSRSKELEEQLQTKESCSVCSAAADAENKANQDRELAAAAEKLAECQETIFLLGKQLKALRPQTELMGSAYSERSRKGDGFAEDEPTTSGMNLQDFDQAEMDAIVSTNHHRAGAESPMDLYNQPCSPSDTESNLSRSPLNSKQPKHRSTKSTSSSSSHMATPEKHSRGFSRFFSAKGKNGN
ncbi:filament-like plant protein 4 isoform X1 [Ricinus communis]|uniref:filament-like plant protein 4 isoform X1 n=1 Tax=Ricinus communis TaxID=3988 RepID=UPI00201AA8B3|nr:filament-like plant protein 4 isoform X1 [Ricinus communis]XP_015575217.2 filament-like plant protein 4 isoform X1 [Ricinus communis]XP_015575221.2 filament-like plant protein 4 isoform X1 [Ricinus communis]XP_015575225.2 filament-like plant protein 4 isoform X1 [Ricinus communis]XP_015575230.2 filament-like plant protein 4 isoform X1 [Ricinus communis]XP_015575234.2 filament-like plant protein 4 isoform X1 [Ricinus communis]